MDPREVARIDGDNVYLVGVTDRLMGPFPVKNYTYYTIIEVV